MCTHAQAYTCTHERQLILVRLLMLILHQVLHEVLVLVLLRGTLTLYLHFSKVLIAVIMLLLKLYQVLHEILDDQRRFSQVT